MCGDKKSSLNLKVHSIGSPPHVRGQGPPAGRPEPLRGITPACAGTRILLLSVFFAVQDHPRMCGDKLDIENIPFETAGSPPHVRGQGSTL